MNSYRKMQNGDWAIAMKTKGTPGDVVTVTLKSGATKQVTLGPWLSTCKMEPPDGDEYFLHFFQPAPDAPRASVEVGSLAGILAVFEKAARHLKFPAILFLVEGLEQGIRVSRAGAKARLPGSLNVTSATKDDSEFGREWFGRVTLDGKFEVGRNVNPLVAGRITEALKAFAADPVKVATKFGRLTGRCCFCRLPLSDERSTAVGYGKICADHFGLPWGAKPAAFACEPAEVA